LAGLFNPKTMNSRIEDIFLSPETAKNWIVNFYYETTGLFIEVGNDLEFSWYKAELPSFLPRGREKLFAATVQRRYKLNLHLPIVKFFPSLKAYVPRPYPYNTIEMYENYLAECQYYGVDEVLSFNEYIHPRVDAWDKEESRRAKNSLRCPKNEHGYYRDTPDGYVMHRFEVDFTTLGELKDRIKEKILIYSIK